MNKIYNRNDIVLFEKSTIYSNYIKTEETIVSKKIFPIYLSKSVEKPKVKIIKIKNKEDNKNKEVKRTKEENRNKEENKFEEYNKNKSMNEFHKNRENKIKEEKKK